MAASLQDGLSLTYPEQPGVQFLIQFAPVQKKADLCYQYNITEIMQ